MNQLFEKIRSAVLRRRKVPTPDIRIVVSVDNPLFFAIGVLTLDDKNALPLKVVEASLSPEPNVEVDGWLRCLTPGKWTGGEVQTVVKQGKVKWDYYPHLKEQFGNPNGVPSDLDGALCQKTP